MSDSTDSESEHSHHDEESFGHFMSDDNDSDDEEFEQDMLEHSILYDDWWGETHTEEEISEHVAPFVAGSLPLSWRMAQMLRVHPYDVRRHLSMAPCARLVTRRVNEYGEFVWRRMP